MSTGELDLDGGTGFDCSEGDLFRAALDTVRSLPGWEVLTAHPESGEIHARQKGRIFSPTIDHVVRIRKDEAHQRARLELVSADARSHEALHDARSTELFQSILVDRVRGGDASGTLQRDAQGDTRGRQRQG